MFAEQGYDAVPVTAIAKAAGVSHMTFFRHFPAKEAVVVSDLFDPLIAEAVRGLIAAMGDEAAHEEMSSWEFHERVRLAARTPSLTAAVRAASQETERAIAEALIVPGTDDAAARAAAGAVMGAASSLLLAWAEGSSFPARATTAAPDAAAGAATNAPDTASGTATCATGDAATALSRDLLTLLGES